MCAIDTNTVLNGFKGSVGAHRLAPPPGEIALLAVVAHQIWVGVLGSQNSKRRLAEHEQFLSVRWTR